MKVWALMSSVVDMYSGHDLVALFADEDVAHAVRVGLIGKPMQRGLSCPWKDDEDFPDLYVRPVDVH